LRDAQPPLRALKASINSIRLMLPALVPRGILGVVGFASYREDNDERTAARRAEWLATQFKHSPDMARNASAAEVVARLQAFSEVAEQHLRGIQETVNVLNTAIECLDLGKANDPKGSASALVEAERRLHGLFLDHKMDLTPSRLEQLRREAESTMRTCFEVAARGGTLSKEAERVRLVAIQLSNWCERTDDTIRQFDARRGVFDQLRVYHRIHYRPRFHEVGPLWLSQKQEELVALRVAGHHRIVAEAGTGKTIVLLHRALRAARDSAKTVFVVPTTSLKEQVLAAIQFHTEHAESMLELRAHLSVKTFAELVTFVTPRGADETRVLSWQELGPLWDEFIDLADEDKKHVLHRAPVLETLGLVRKRLPGDRHSTGISRPCPTRRRYYLQHWRELEYLFEELQYVCSGFFPANLSEYVGTPGRRPLREGREIPLDGDQRQTVLLVLRSWRRWLQSRGFIDASTAAGELVESWERASATKGDGFPSKCADHIFIDEGQSYGACEWSFLAFVGRLDRVRDDSLVAAGDVQQRARTVCNEPARIRSPRGQRVTFRGRSRRLTEQFRTTREILEAAMRLVAYFRGGRTWDEDHEQVRDSNVRNGHRPLLLLGADNEKSLCTAFENFSPNRSLAVLASYEDDALAAKSLAGRLRSVVKRRVDYGTTGELVGCEFDVVVLVNFSSLPRPSLPPDEWWRDASVAYTGLTRAKEFVLLLCPSSSPFVDVLTAEPACVEIVGAPKDFRTLFGS
jgi:hypothetical protein